MIIPSALVLHMGTGVLRLIFLGQVPSYVVGFGGYVALQLRSLRLGLRVGSAFFNRFKRFSGQPTIT